MNLTLIEESTVKQGEIEIIDGNKNVHGYSVGEEPFAFLNFTTPVYDNQKRFCNFYTTEAGEIKIMRFNE